MTKMKCTLFLVLFLLLLSVYAETTFFDQDDDFIMGAGTSSAGEGVAASSPATAGDSGSSCALGYNLTRGKCVLIENGSISASNKNETVETPISPESNQSEEAEEKLVLTNESTTPPTAAKENWPPGWALTILVGITLIFLIWILVFRGKERR